MASFTIPRWVKESYIHYNSIEDLPQGFIEKLKNDLKKYHVENPEVSIVIPAYNEEKDIIKTLCSFANMRSRYRAELIVANNNSKDRTQEILDRLEVQSVFVQAQGVAFARQAGLEQAKGKYILNADSDSVYPPTWIDGYVEALKNPEVTCAYGPYSFIPSRNTRFTLATYETVSRTFFTFKRMNKERECVNVMGLNFAFRREDALKAGGYRLNLQRHITGRCEDGMMAFDLMKLGRLQYVSNGSVTAWTSDRRLMADGSLGQALVNRMKKEINRIAVYFKPTTAE